MIHVLRAIAFALFLAFLGWLAIRLEIITLPKETLDSIQLTEQVTEQTQIPT